MIPIRETTDRTDNGNLIESFWDASENNILRAIFKVGNNFIFLITAVFNGTDLCCAKLQYETCGWYMDDGFINPVEFLGDLTPLQVYEILKVSNAENDGNAIELITILQVLTHQIKNKFTEVDIPTIKHIFTKSILHYLLISLCLI